MGCTHCLVDATPDGEHMPVEVFKQTLDFIDRTGETFLQISGGEPTDHPELLTLLELAQGRVDHILLTSNGLFFEEPGRWEEIRPLISGIQVTNDPRFYPRTVTVPEDGKISLETAIRQVSPFGRALKNGLPCNRQSPLCFNLRSMTRSYRDLKKALLGLRMRGYYCTPSVNIDGSVAAGETSFCTTIGQVTDDLDTLTRNLISMTCDRCGLVDQLGHDHKKAIGEARIILL